MEVRLVENVMEHADRGHKVLFDVDHLGSVRIKIKHGLFKLRTVLYETDAETAEVIKDQIALLNFDPQSHKLGANTAISPADVPTVVYSPKPQRGVQGGSRQGSEQVLATNTYDTTTPSIPPLKEENSIDSNPVESFRFADEEINAAWLNLVDGTAPPAAARIWSTLSRSKSVTKIAFQVQVPTRECMVWLYVFRRYLSIVEENSSGTYKYSRDPRSDDLALEIWKKLHGSN